MKVMLPLILALVPISHPVAPYQVKSITIGQSVESRLNEQSTKREEIPYERWIFAGRKGQQITIEMSSDQFDSQLRLIDANENIITTDDNGGIGYNARIVISLPKDGSYQLETSANWKERGGNYRLSIVNGETPIKIGKEKSEADVQYFDRCLAATNNASWGSELQSGKLLPLLLLQRDGDARTAAETAATLAKNSNDKYALANSFFNIALSFVRFYDEHEKAIPYFEEALALRRNIDDINGQAAVLRALGDSYQAIDNYGQARVYYQIAVELYRKLKDRNSEGYTLLGLAESYRLNKNANEALPFYEQALACSREVNNRRGEGYTLIGLADCYRVLDKYDRALPLYEQAATIARDIKERSLEGVAQAGLADGYRYLSNYEKAIPIYEQNLVIRRELKDRRGEAYTLNGLAQCERATNQFARAASHYDQMRAICKENNDLRGQQLALTGLALNYRSLEQYQAAVPVYEQLLMIVRELKDRKGEFNALIGIGNTHRALNNYQRALPYLEQALAINDELKDANGLDLLLRALATTSFAAMQYPQTITYANKLRTLKQETKDRKGEASALLLLARASRAAGDTNTALNSYKESRTIFNENKDYVGEYSCYYGLAELARVRNDQAAIQENYETALKIIENNSLSTKTTLEELPGIVAPYVIYQSYAETLAMGQKFGDALRVIERARTYQLRDQILNGGELAKRVEPILQRYNTVDLNEVKQIALRLNSTIVEYFATGEGLITIAIKSDGTIVGHYRAIKLAQLNDLIDKRRGSLESKNPRSEKLRNLITGVEGSNNITAAPEEENPYDLFFPELITSAFPAEAEARILLVTSGKLATIPFADLRDTQGKPLVDRYTVLTTPSLNAISAAIRARAGKMIVEGSFLLGNVNTANIGGKNLPPLEGIKDDLNNVASQLKVRPISEAAATKAAFRDQGSNRRITHLATYAVIDDRQPSSSAIIFAPEVNEIGTVVNNGQYSVAELIEAQLNLDLLIISSAQTGFNPTSGEGITMFNNALSLAGCSATLMTLWNVDAKVVALFEKSFYEKFKKSNDIAASFHAAQLKTKEKYPAAAQWASFILVGEPIK